MCKTAPRQTLIRCSCGRSPRTRERWGECVRHRGDTGKHVFRFYCAREFNENSRFRASVCQNTGRTSTPTFLSARKEKFSCILGNEVFLLRVVLVGFVFLYSSTREEEMVYVFLFPLDHLSCACPLHTTTTSIPQTPLGVWDG